MLLSYHHLHHIVNTGILENAKVENINPASIDVCLGNTILRESPKFVEPVDLQAKESINFQTLTLDDEEIYTLKPGEFILAQTIEVFNLPNHIAGEFRLKSTAARNGLDQSLAVWLDPGWNGSVLTIELKNISRYHSLILRPGMKIGQVVFFQCFPVPDEHSYAVKGQYNNDKTTQAGKELK
jgi:dCTP deaminase